MSSNLCANCGKEGSDVTNTCNKCKEVMYCNAACKKKHRHKHKKECERRVAEMHDELLFKQPPPLEEDCPICFLRMPSIASVKVYMACCGKVICRGCVHAVSLRDADELCPFCRIPSPTSQKVTIEGYKKRMELNDARAIHNIGSFYANGSFGLPQNMAKALELWHRAAELGRAESYYNIGILYDNGRGVGRDEQKANHYYELAAAMSGHVLARHNLGAMEEKAGNMDRALKHWMISVGEGDDYFLECIKRLYMETNASKDDYTKALRLYQAYLDDIKSEQRDEAAAFDDDWKYY